MALEVIQRPEEELFTQENPTIYDTPYYTSRFNAANLPLVYKITNTKFPVNSEDAIEDISSVTNNGGFAQLVLNSATYNFLNKGYVEVTNTNSYNGVWQIIEDIDLNNIVINAPFVADESGNVQNYYNNYSTLVKVFAGLPEEDPLNSTKPMTLITDNPITVTPNSDNEAIIDVSALVKSTMSLDNNYDVVDKNLYTAFYIEYSEQYDESDGTTVSTTTETFVEDEIAGCTSGGTEFITNGDFATDLSSWSNVSSGVSFVFDTGAAQVTLDSSNRRSKILSQVGIGTTEGVEYNLTLDYVLGSNNVQITVSVGSISFQNDLTGTGSVDVKFIAGSLDVINIDYVLKSTPGSPQDLRLDNVSVTNQLVNPCLAYGYAVHGALNPQSKYGGNLGEYVQNFNGGLFANKWLTLFDKPVLFKGNYFDLSTLIPQQVIQSAVQSGGYFLQILEYNKNGVNIEETNYPITQNLGGGIYRFRLDDKTFNDNTKTFTAQILRVPVNLFVDADQGTFNNNITGITSDAESQIVRDTTLSFEGAASLRTRSYFDPTDSFIFTADTTSPTETFTLPLLGSGAYDFVVDWGDGNVDQITAFDQAEVTHTYSTANTYTVSLNGIIEGFSFNDAGDKLKITNISQWGGTNGVKFTLGGCFNGCSNLDVTATDLPNFSLTTTIDEFFKGCSSLVFNTSINSWDVSGIVEFQAIFDQCSSFNQPLNNWDTSSGQLFSNLFNGASVFNQNIGSWDMSSATDLTQMFRDALNFNNGGSSDIGNWNTSNVATLLSMFDNAQAFNQPIGTWNTGSVTNMDGVFARCTIFNQSLNNWDVSNVTTFGATFAFAPAFNQPLNLWNTASATRFTSMFQSANSFDQDLSNFNLTNVTAAPDMFTGIALSTANYNALLIGWEAQAVQNNVTFGGGNSTYTLGGAAETARTNLINDHSWTITDGGGI